MQLISREHRGSLPQLSLLSLSSCQLPPQTLLLLLLQRYFVIRILLVLAAPFPSLQRVATSSHAPSLPRSTFTYFTSLVTLQLIRLVCRNSEEQFSHVFQTHSLTYGTPQLILQPNLWLLCLHRLSLRPLSQGKLQHLRNTKLLSLVRVQQCRQTL